MKIVVILPCRMQIKLVIGIVLSKIEFKKNKLQYIENGIYIFLWMAQKGQM